MVTLYESAYAKLNLTLDVLGKRPDGYHDLQSVMQTVSLRDEIELELDTGRDWSLECGAPGIPEDSRNLAWKAAEVFCAALGKRPDGLTIRIHKAIPSGAGMGGGSADAAAVLRALNRHYGLPFSEMELADLGAMVGSDVPFCVLCGTAMAEGRGERLRKLPGMPDCPMVICKPEFSVSTPELYRVLDTVEIAVRPDNAAMEAALAARDLAMLCRNICNVFEPVVSAAHPEIGRIKALCARAGALAVQMTGSGSAVFAVMPDKNSAAAAAEALKAEFSQVFTARPV